MPIANGHPSHSFPVPSGEYTFPRQRLKPFLEDAGKQPIVLVACGSFSPITYLHLRMFEMAKDFIKHSGENFELVGAYFSPVSDHYKKGGLEKAVHRNEMVRLAISSSNYIDLDEYETLMPQYTPTAQVLDHFRQCLNHEGGILTKDGRRREIRPVLLAGADLLSTMNTPGVWSEHDIDIILSDRYGAFIVERYGEDLAAALKKLEKWKDNIYVILQKIQNDVSSTKPSRIRSFLKEQYSVEYLLDPEVVRYIGSNQLFS